MFYETKKKDHGLPYNPFKAIVAPRPIGWISTLSGEGVPNLAPYSFFNGISDSPEMVMFASDGWKDSANNIKETGEFVCNYASYSMLDEMNASSAPVPNDINEFDLAQIETAPSNLVAVPRVKKSPACLECKLNQFVELNPISGEKSDYLLVIGEVVGVHIDEDYLTDGRFDVQKADPYTRLGYKDYGRLGELFSLERPFGQ